MLRILNVGYGKKTFHQLFLQGNISSRVFYGIEELRQDYAIQDASLESSGRWKVITNNLMMLASTDIIFFSYFYESPLFLLALLKRLGLPPFRSRKIVAISHKTLKSAGSSTLKRWYYQLIYGSIDTLLFHSQKNLEESQKLYSLKPERLSFLYWGENLDFVDRHYQPKPGTFFISTGREQRDFKVLIDAFAQQSLPLEVYTNRDNYDNHYDFLADEQGKYENIHIEFVEKSTQTTVRLAQRTSECLCVLIPILPDQINYCVGLTSVIEAMAMSKPIIMSKNPYCPVDVEKEGIGFVVDDAESWRKAAQYLATHQAEAEQMGKKARILAEQSFNINATVKQLDSIFKELCKDGK